MAFNPFAGFAKYKRFWMGAVMILVMITFVLCSGTKGDMGDILLRVFRFGGTPVVSIDGSTYYRHDFDKIIKQRKVANDFMRTYAKITIDVLNERLRALGESKDDNAKQLIQQYGLVRQLLTLRTKDPKFFDTGVKGDELIDFQVWLAEADRLRINFTGEQLLRMVNEELYKQALTDINIPQLETKVMQELRNSHGYEVVTSEFVMKALENEFRVRLAKLADAEYQMRTLGQQQLNPFKRIASDRMLPAVTKRTPLSPGQVWDYYQENRKEFDVALLPITVEGLIDTIAEPDAKKLQDLFDKYKKSTFDPSSDQPGFKKPQQIRVQYVSADKNSPYFKNIANTVNLLTQHPIAPLVPQMPMITAINVLAGPSVFDAMLELEYYTKISRERAAREEYSTGPGVLMDPEQPAAAFRARRNPIAVAAMVGAALRPDGPFAAIPALMAFPYTEKSAELKTAGKAQARQLATLYTPIYATAVASGTVRPGLLSFFQLQYISQFDTPPLPLPVVRSDIMKARDARLIEKFIATNMGVLKKKLEDEKVLGKPLQVQRWLERYGPAKAGETRDPEFRDLGLEIGQTEKFYDRYSIKDAPELKPLREAYDRYYKMVNGIEGRDIKPELVLKDDEFWRLFFDPSEAYGAARGKFEAKPWPPVIKTGTPTQLEMFLKSGELEGQPQLANEVIRQAHSANAGKDTTGINLFATSDRPFLFWKMDEKAAEIPENLSEVKDKVAHAAKMLQARENKVLPYARKIAESLLAGNADYASVLKQDPKFGSNVITLDRIAPLYLDAQQGGASYEQYKLKRGLINYPREDMVAQILSLGNLQKPIKIDVPDIDRLNEDLFNEAKAKKVNPVQVLTNKPRDTYYLAVVPINRGANANEFYFGVLPALTRMHLLFDRAAEKISDEHYLQLKQQLRKDHRVNVLEGAKLLDNDGGV